MCPITFFLLCFDFKWVESVDAIALLVIPLTDTHFTFYSNLLIPLNDFLFDFSLTHWSLSLKIVIHNANIYSIIICILWHGDWEINASVHFSKLHFFVKNVHPNHFVLLLDQNNHVCSVDWNTLKLSDSIKILLSLKRTEENVTICLTNTLRWFNHCLFSQNEIRFLCGKQRIDGCMFYAESILKLFYFLYNLGAKE